MTELTPSGALDADAEAVGGEADGAFDLGADLIIEESSSDSPTGPEAPAVSSSSDAAGNGSTDLSQLSPSDLLQRDTNSLPDEWKSAQAWMRSRQAASDRQLSELQNQVRAAQQQQETANQVGTAVKEAIHGPESQDPYYDLKENIRRAEGYTPGDETSIDVMDQIVQRKYGEQMQQMQQFQQNAANVMRQLAGAVAQSAAVPLDAEVSQLRQAHGSEFVAQFFGANKGAIHALMKQANPATGKAFSVTEAFELLSGRKGQQQAAAQARDRNARNDAKRTIAGAGVMTDNSDGAPLSESDLLAQVEALPGFQGRSY